MITQNSIVFDANKEEYIVQNFLGEGSFGRVYKIKKKVGGDIFALKTLNDPFVNNDMIKAFLNEGEKTKEISHPNVIKYIFFHDGSLYTNLPMYIIMEYANEGNLEEMISERKSENKLFSNDDLLKIFKQLIAGMDAINKVLIHRDIKPDNILIKDGQLKISDFGLSKIVTQATRTSTFKGLGCIPYLAPEGWNFEKNTIQMDIYSMGIVFYYLSSFKFPYSPPNGSIDEWKKAHLFSIPKPLDSINQKISPIISRVIIKMMEKNCINRFNNWIEISNELSKTTIPKSSDGELIETIVKRWNTEKLEAEKAAADKRQKLQEIEEFRNLILHQLNTELIEPIKDFVESINYVSPGRILLHNTQDVFFTNISCAGRNIVIGMSPLFKKNFIREVKDHRFPSGVFRGIVMPQLDGKEVLAWGLIKASDGRGFNVLLLKDDDNLYGRWALLFNSHHVFNNLANRPTPFPFEFNELERELQLVRSTHIYVTEVCGLEIDRVKAFLSAYF